MSQFLPRAAGWNSGHPEKNIRRSLNATKKNRPSFASFPPFKITTKTELKYDLDSPHIKRRIAHFYELWAKSRKGNVGAALSMFIDQAHLTKPGLIQFLTPQYWIVELSQKEPRSAKLTQLHQQPVHNTPRLCNIQNQRRLQLLSRRTLHPPRVPQRPKNCSTQLSYLLKSKNVILPGKQIGYFFSIRRSCQTR